MLLAVPNSARGVLLVIARKPEGLTHLSKTQKHPFFSRDLVIPTQQESLSVKWGRWGAAGPEIQAG